MVFCFEQVNVFHFCYVAKHVDVPYCLNAHKRLSTMNAQFNC